MAKLYLKFGDAVVKEVVLSGGVVTIGRLPDNLLQVDNPVVSGHHARVYWEEDHYAIEDLKTTNGTYINDEPIQKARLNPGDVVRVGKHTLEYKEEPGESRSGSRRMVDRAAHWQKEVDKDKMKNLDSTAFMDQKRVKEILASKKSSAASKTPTQVQGKTAVIRVTKGKTDKPEYTITDKTSVIGKSAMASIRLKGWFAPETAAVISRKADVYHLTPTSEDVPVLVNNEPLTSSRELREGDAIEVAGVTLSFAFLE